jgi:hypothetical protein
MVVDPGEAQIGKGETPQPRRRLVWGDDAGTDVVKELA